MLLGSTLYSHDADGLTYYGAWFPRGGNSAVFVCDTINAGNLGSCQVTVETKKAEEDDSAATAVGAAASLSIVANNRTSFERGTGITGAGFEDLVRFKYVVKHDGAFPGPELGYIHFRMLDPSWASD
jgi:hypothetical protein